MDVKIACPLGSKCEEIKDNQPHRCAWYTKLVGKDPQSEKTYDEWACAISWLPIMMTEVAQTNRFQSAAIESFRNDMVRGQEQFNALILNTAKTKALGGM